MFIATFAFAFMLVHVTAKLPPYIQVCDRKNPNLDQCILNSVNHLKEKLCNGIPELNVPSLEPFIIDELALFNIINSKLYLKNLIINGLCDFTINSFHMDIEKNHFDINLFFKHIRINGTFEIDMHVLVPIVQSGRIVLTTDNVNTIGSIDMKVITKNGKKYAYISQLTINLDVKEYKTEMFEMDNKELNQLREIFRNMLGSNQQEIIATFKSPLEKVISKQILKFSNDIVKHFTYEELFPESV